MPSVPHSPHLEDKELELYLKAQQSREEAVQTEVHLQACEDCVQRLAEQDKYLWCLSELSAGELSVDGERRRYPRVATDEAASVQVLSPFSARVWEVRIVDVSKGGIRTLTPQPLVPGSLVRLTMRFSVSCGDVRYCNPADDGFHAGVRLHDYFLV